MKTKRNDVCPICMLLMVSLMFFTGEACSQEEITSGALEGFVADRVSSIMLYGASIHIMDSTIGVMADTNGKYILEDIEPGIYNIRFSMIGYQTLVKTNVSISPGRITELSVELEPQAVELDEVTVRARETYFEKDPEMEVSGRTIDTQEIMSSSGGLMDIQRVVQVLPSVVSGTDEQNEIIVRGGNYGENLFVMDGIEIPNPNHFAYQGAGGGPISLLRTEFIKDVNFLAGAFPARFGDKASSVMDISLRRGNSERVMKTLDMSMAGIGVMAEGPLGEKGTFLVSARKSYLDLVIANSGLTAVPRYYNLQGKATWNLNNHHTLTWNAVFGDDAIRIKPGEGENDEEDDEHVDFSSSMMVQGFTLKSALSKSLVSEVVVSYVSNNWDTDVWEEGKSRSEAFYNNLSEEAETSAKADLTWFVGKHEISGGISLKNSLFDHDVYADVDTVFSFLPDPQFPDDRAKDINMGIATDDEGNPLIYDPWRDKKHVNTLKTAAYSQLRLQASNRLTLRFGGRYDHVEYTGDSHVSPRMGARYQLRDNLWINGAYGIHYQSPAYIMLTANDKNKDLIDYHTEQVVLGTEWFPRPDLRVTFEGYSKKYRDVPVFKSWTTPDPWDDSQGEMVNAAKGHAEGVELYVHKKMSTSYMYIISYSFYRAWYEDPRTGDERPWDFDHRHVFTANMSKRWNLQNAEWYRGMQKKTWYKFVGWILPFGDEVMLSAKWRYTGGRPYTESAYLADKHVWIVPGDQPYNTERFPAYHRLDIRVDRRYYYKNWSLVVYLDVMNVYGRENIWDYSRNEFGELDEINQFSTFPVGGFSVEF